MVTVLGGGIAGTALAAALAHRKHPVTVYERQTAQGAGAFMVLDGHAHQALADLGVPLDLLHRASHSIPGFRFHYLPDGRMRGQGHRLYQRVDLMNVLTEYAAAAAADIRYGQTVTDVDVATGTLFDHTGEIATDTTLIAADGVDSLARSRLEPDRHAEYAGQVVIYGTIPHRMALDTEPDVMHFHGRLGDGPLPISTFGHMWNDHGVWWFTRLTRDPIAPDTGAQPTTDWADAIRGADPTAADLIDTILAATDTIHLSNARNVPLTDARPPQLPVVLCGDADHAFTPAAAARGAREAIEDALALATALTTGESAADAMATRRDRITTDRQQQMRIVSRAIS
ncbi:FAD-dependent monooxygenase [Nocardia transvalensis]|uniref:FAD-dependent monooxygenase n=1 Tax=Nocardia transvalensis TaxID=37333 RepID=UPI0018942D3D|nr:FAD-dependent monooxygenase [Nocardia transvalensis]MBF6331148.1 FAD-dependent monooxygenase [Nocardia transvalensis]